VTAARIHCLSNRGQIPPKGDVNPLDLAKIVKASSTGFDPRSHFLKKEREYVGIDY